LSATTSSITTTALSVTAATASSAVIDNFSRRIFAQRVAETFAPQNSVAVLLALDNSRLQPKSGELAREWRVSVEKARYPDGVAFADAQMA
jgi:hypothetical protein